MEIDLQPFVCTDPGSPRLARPWSRGQWSYATNGHILIRIPRRDDIPENNEAPDAEALFIKAAAESYLWRSIPRGARSLEGEVDFTHQKKIVARFHGPYLKLIKDFPEIQIGIADSKKPAWLYLCGGAGLLMPIEINPAESNMFRLIEAWLEATEKEVRDGVA